MLAFATLGVLIPFYYYNVFGKAEKGRKIFMGDTGSLTIGMRQHTAMVTIVVSSTVLTFLNILLSAYINSNLLLSMYIALWITANILITKKIQRLVETRKDPSIISFDNNKKL